MFDVLNDVSWEIYGSWLLQFIGFKRRGYSILMKELHNMEFYYTIKMDENRAEDGIALRRIYANREKIVGFRPCSVLEMLVALAMRCENEYIGDPKSPHPERFFWKMCQNLGLDAFKNQKKHDDLKGIIRFWLDRRYSRNGEGGLFPIKNAKKDYRKEEIWSQMMGFLSENY